MSSAPTSLLSLPTELILKICRSLHLHEEIGIVEGPSKKSRIPSSSQFFRCCKTIADDGRTVLYGENKFVVKFEAALETFINTIARSAQFVKNLGINVPVKKDSDIDSLDFHHTDAFSLPPMFTRILHQKLPTLGVRLVTPILRDIAGDEAYFASCYRHVKICAPHGMSYRLAKLSLDSKKQAKWAWESGEWWSQGLEIAYDDRWDSHQYGGFSRPSHMVHRVGSSNYFTKVVAVAIGEKDTELDTTTPGNLLQATFPPIY
ncbi:hypothetical protein EJ08DRAFT_717830 [Tothia fuscella]|uniref:F-box domain-containing protein n=1 Tax=Tothia fuscella TaxID=1048955 RepID=A0A9P4U4A5_9PEZI|nr:hypothetical protein EJ08DRAFT_717830 [Tothia fuscella]